MAGSLGRRITRPLRRYLDWRFDRIEEPLKRVRDSAERWEMLGRVDLTRHNERGTAPTFERLVSQVVSAAQFDHPGLVGWRQLLFPADARREGLEGFQPLNRKHWEHCYILEAAKQNGVLRAGNRAVGFGVGTEPIPAALALHGLHVLATDRDPAESSPWTASGQHMTGPAALSFPSIVADAELARAVSLRYVDMTAIPSDLGRFDLVWSAGSLEHLGSVRAGIDFVLDSLELLAPGGVAVHTTELELIPKQETRNYGHLVAYQPRDLDGLVATIRARGVEIEANWMVCLDTPADRWISTPPYSGDEHVHLKVAVGDSVVTSVGILACRPLAPAD